MKTKFKVGQKVLVARKGDCWNMQGAMDHWIGKVMTIREITDYGSYRMEEDLKENCGMVGSLAMKTLNRQKASLSQGAVIR